MRLLPCLHTPVFSSPVAVECCLTPTHRPAPCFARIIYYPCRSSATSLGVGGGLSSVFALTNSVPGSVLPLQPGHTRAGTSAGPAPGTRTPWSGRQAPYSGRLAKMPPQRLLPTCTPGYLPCHARMVQNPLPTSPLLWHLFAAGVLEFPAFLSESLEVLCLNDNHLDAIPPSVCLLKSLSELYLGK